MEGQVGQGVAAAVYAGLDVVDFAAGCGQVTAGEPQCLSRLRTARRRWTGTVSTVEAMSSGRLMVAAGMPVARRRSQAARPDGPDSNAMA